MAAAAAADHRSVLVVVVESVRATVVAVAVESVGATVVVESGGTTVVEVGEVALDAVAAAILEGVVALDIDVVSLRGTLLSRSSNSRSLSSDSSSSCELYSSSELATPMRIEDDFAERIGGYAGNGESGHESDLQGSI